MQIYTYREKLATQELTDAILGMHTYMYTHSHTHTVLTAKTDLIPNNPTAMWNIVREIACGEIAPLES